MKPFYTLGINVKQYANIYYHSTRGAYLLWHQWHSLNDFRKLPSQTGVNLINILLEFIRMEGIFYKFKPA